MITMAKRKGITWGPKNPLWRWQHKAKPLNTRTANRSSKVRTMPKKKARRRFFRRWRRSHRRDNRFPLSAGIGLATSIIAPAGLSPGLSVLDYIKAGNLDYALEGFVHTWTGIDIPMKGGGSPNIDVIGALNPLDFAHGAAWKTTLWSALTMKLVKKFIHQDPLKRVPIVGKMVKFS